MGVMKAGFYLPLRSRNRWFWSSGESEVSGYSLLGYLAYLSDGNLPTSNEEAWTGISGAH